MLEEGKRLLEEEERKAREILERAQTIHYKGLKILYSKETLPDKSVLQEYSLLIERNAFNPKHTSIIRGKADVDLSRVFRKYEKVFLHKNGFIAVINREVEEIDPRVIANLLLE